MTWPAADSAASDSARRDAFAQADEGGIAKLIGRLRNRWWLIVVAMAVCLAAAGAYLLLATPVYTVTAIVMAERTRPPIKTDLPPDEFFASQEALLRSPEVGGTPDIEVKTDPADSTITLSLETQRPQTAVLTLSRVTDAYLKAAGGEQSSVARKLTELAATRDKLAAERAAKDKAITDFKEQAKLSGTATDEVIDARRQQLAGALETARKEAAAAQITADAAANLPQNPKELEPILAAARKTGAFTAIDNDRAQSEADLAKSEELLAKQKQTYLSQHPALQQTQRRIEMLKEHLAALQGQYATVYRAYCTQQLQAANNKVNELQLLHDKQAQRTQSASTGTQTLQQLEADVKKADEAVAAIDKQIRESTLSVDSGMRIKLLQPATAPDRPSRPNRVNILVTAGVIGLIAGLALALAGKRRE